jgi:hypothetical protein
MATIEKSKNLLRASCYKAGPMAVSAPLREVSFTERFGSLP